MSADPHPIPYAPAGTRRLSLLLKRGLDIAVAGLGLVALLPVFALIALAVLCEGGRPVLYVQERYGLDRKVFRIVKFRTLLACDTTAQFRQVVVGDARITRIGAFLRRTNLDELPQLWNVLLGDMSLVGPRPHPLALDEHHAQRLPNYWARYAMRPGITGWAQVCGLRGPTDHDTMAQRVAADLSYVARFSLWLDLRILVLTVFSATAFRNAL